MCSMARRSFLTPHSPINRSSVSAPRSWPISGSRPSPSELLKSVSLIDSPGMIDAAGTAKAAVMTSPPESVR